MRLTDWQIGLVEVGLLAVAFVIDRFIRQAKRKAGEKP